MASTQSGRAQPQAHLMGDRSQPSSVIDIPLLPSQISGSYDVSVAPAQLIAEQKPALTEVTSTSYPANVPGPAQNLWQSDYDFATIANDMINKSLGRTPGGTSVVEPDSVLDESGRLYHGFKEGKYVLPNDAAEQDRLDLQHTIFRMTLDGWLALAPLSRPPPFVLDVGTGTGIWAIEFAEQNPSSYVIGTDLSAIQPTPAVPNCSFVKDDVEEPWCYPHPAPDHSSCSGQCEHWIKFDYVHLRLVLTCFDDTRLVMKRALDNMAPGGHIEFQDTVMEFYQANTAYTGDAFLRWADGCNRGLAAIGRDGKKAWKYKEWLEEVGFVDVVHRQIWGPVTPWSDDPKLKLLGAYGQANMYDGVHGIGWKLLKLAGMSTEEVEGLIQEARRELRHKDNHLYGCCHVVYGRKPFPNEVV